MAESHEEYMLRVVTNYLNHSVMPLVWVGFPKSDYSIYSWFSYVNGWIKGSIKGEVSENESSLVGSLEIVEEGRLSLEECIKEHPKE